MVPLVLRVGGVQLSVAEPVVDVVDTTIATSAAKRSKCRADADANVRERAGLRAARRARQPARRRAERGPGWPFAMLKVRVLPSGSRAVGVNANATPVRTEVGGVPEIVGG